ncbi:GntR family transcriptional regulator [Ramlibacter sp. AN1015]|uniref:GntR family transcriptional regulator n=1 Tax=Ramlibacter sp. AN1015 TaxID=3133428 RepID=UPI0030BFA6B3
MATTARATLHARVADDLVRRIRAGEWPVGSSLPSEMVLCEQAGVSRHTLRHALRNLRDRGLIELRQGAASKVISCTQPRIYSQDFNTLRDVLRYPSNTVRHNKLEQYVECDAQLQPVLKAPVGSSWYRIGAVRCDEHSKLPLAWTDIYILGRFARVTKLKNHPHEMVFEQIERHFGVAIHRAEVEIKAGVFSTEHAQQLQVPAGTPCLDIVRRYFDSAGDPFEVSVTRHIAERFTFTMELRSIGLPAPP